MNEQTLRGPGRPRKHEPGEVTKVTLELPVDLWQYVTEVAPKNRTQWIVDAIQEKRKREERQ